jgi:hypothetical protein
VLVRILTHDLLWSIHDHFTGFSSLVSGFQKCA